MNNYQAVQRSCDPGSAQTRLHRAPEFFPLLYPMEERAGERRSVLIGKWAAPLLGPLPTRSSRGEEGELDAAIRHGVPVAGRFDGHLGDFHFQSNWPF